VSLATAVASRRTLSAAVVIDRDKWTPLRCFNIRMTDPEHHPRLWRYPFKWLREESFWHGMTTSTLSAALVGAGTFIGARWVGLVKMPWHMVLMTIVASSMWIAVIALTGFAISVVVIQRIRHRATRHSRHANSIEPARRTLEHIERAERGEDPDAEADSHHGDNKQS
jgi:hypothetical protein